MKKKNLIFLTLLISVLMVSVVSAGITGYLVSRGGGIATDGYTATLQKVDASGVASISVQTPSGSTEVVRVAEGETAKVGEVEISASSLTRGNLFRRSGAKIEIARGSVVAGTASVMGSSGSTASCGTCQQTQQAVLDMFNNASTLWGHDGMSCSQECSQQLNATCILSVLSYRDRVDGTTGYLTQNIADNFVWGEVPHSCNTIYDMEPDLSLAGWRANFCLCAKPL